MVDLPDTNITFITTLRAWTIEKFVWYISVLIFLFLLTTIGLLYIGIFRYARPLWMMSRSIVLADESVIVKCEASEEARNDPISKFWRKSLDFILYYLVELFRDKKVGPGPRLPYSNQNDEIGLFSRRCNALLDEVDNQKRIAQEAAAHVHAQAESTRNEALKRAETLGLIHHEIKNDLHFLQNSNLTPAERIRLSQRIKTVFSALDEEKSPEHVRFEIERVDVIDFMNMIIGNAAGAIFPLGFSHKFDTPVYCSLEKTYFEQVITNVLTNANEARTEGSAITVIASQRNDSLEITIKNIGPKVEERYLNEIFKRFFSMGKKKIESNIGVGLWTSRIYIERMGGRIYGANHRDGFKIHIELPII